MKTTREGHFDDKDVEESADVTAYAVTKGTGQPEGEGKGKR